MTAKSFYDPIRINIEPLSKFDKRLFLYYVVLDSELGYSEIYDLELVYDADNKIEIEFIEYEKKIIGIDIFNNMNDIPEKELNELLNNIKECMYNVRNMFP
jgi:predicted nucleic-acid-binding Zn-ribbon protein